jgi:hypothetical protein
MIPTPVGDDTNAWPVLSIRTTLDVTMAFLVAENAVADGRSSRRIPVCSSVA